MHRRPAMGGNLVDDEISVNEIPHHVSSRACGGGAQELKAFVKFLAYRCKKFLGHFNGFALCLNVLLMDNVLVLIHEHGLGSSGADINPQIDLELAPRRLFSPGNDDIFGELGLLEAQGRGLGKIASHLICHGLQVNELRLILSVPTESKEGRAQCSHGGMVRGHKNLRKIAAEGIYLEFVAGDAADEHHRVIHLLARNNGTNVIGSISLMQAGDDIFKRLTFVLQVDHVRLGKDRAAAGHRGRAGVFLAQSDEVGDDLGDVFLRKRDIFVVEK